jgi:DNA-binding transcriptional LysR family regulator
MELESIQIFLEVMRRESFSDVARSRDVASSTISRVVSSLEEELSVRLLNRSTRQVTPTEAGLLFAERVEPLLDRFEDAREAAAAATDTPVGILRLTAPVTFAQKKLVPLFPEFAERYPDIDIDLVLTDRLLDLIEDRIDIAIRLGHLADSSHIGMRLGEMEYVACASPGYIEAHGEPEHPSDLVDHACLRYPVPDFTARWLFRRDDEVTDVAVDGRFTVSNGAALTELAVAGMGVALLPRWNVARELERGELVSLLDDWEKTASSFNIGVWLLYPSRDYVPLKVRAFRDFLRAEFLGEG